MNFNFILNTIVSFKKEYEKATVITVVSQGAYERMEQHESELFDVVGTMFVINSEKAAEASVRLLYGLLKEEMLLVGIDCPLEIEQAIRNTSTGLNNYRLLY